MRVLELQDREGDPIYVSAFAIVGLEVVAIQSSPSDDVWRATSIRTAAGRINVAEAIGVVYERWMAAMSDEAAPMAMPTARAHPTVKGLLDQRPDLYSYPLTPALDRKGDPV